LGKAAPPPRAVPAPRRAPSPVPPPPRPAASPSGSASSASSAAPTLPATPAARRSSPTQPPPQPTTMPTTTIGELLEVSMIESLIDQGRLEDALAAYKTMRNKHPHDRGVRAGVELCEGLRALAVRDRPAAAQRFENALEIDPSNERAARELA